MEKREPKSLAEIDAARAKNKFAALREKLSKAADDPDVREAMVRYIQNLLREESR
jgi:hypothetical protein